jgi:hypothetical protein
METEGSWPLGEPGSERPRGYEPPRVERVLTPLDLEHEVLYAGTPASPPPPPPP